MDRHVHLTNVDVYIIFGVIFLLELLIALSLSLSSCSQFSQLPAGAGPGLLCWPILVQRRETLTIVRVGTWPLI